MINTYIIHYDKLTERKEYLYPLVRNAFWITATNKDNLSTKIKNEFYIENKEWWQNRCNFINYQNPPTYRILGCGEISCAVNHFKAWEKFHKEDDNEYGLFLEDDIILYDNFYDRLNSIIVNAPEFDIMFLGGGYHHSIAPTVSNVEKNGVSYIYKGHPSTNCVCSYVIKKELAKNITKFYSDNQFVLPIDYEMNYILKILDSKILHIDPPLCTEGSAIGKYQSCQSR